MARLLPRFLLGEPLHHLLVGLVALRRVKKRVVRGFRIALEANGPDPPGPRVGPSPVEAAPLVIDDDLTELPFLRPDPGGLA